MDKFETFIQILQVSSEKNGPNKVLTIGHILNIAKLASKTVDEHTSMQDKAMDSAMDEIMMSQCGDR